MANIKKNNEQEKALNSVMTMLKEIEQLDTALSDMEQYNYEENSCILSFKTKENKKIKFDISSFRRDISIILTKNKKSSINAVLGITKKYDIELDEREIALLGLSKKNEN